MMKQQVVFIAPEPLGHRNGHSDMPGCCWSVRQSRLGLFRRRPDTKWPLGPAWVRLECPAGSFGPVSVLPGRSKWPLKAASATTWPSKWPLGPAQVLVERPAGHLGLFRRCQGAQNDCSEPPVRSKRLLPRTYKLLPASLPSGPARLPPTPASLPLGHTFACQP